MKKWEALSEALQLSWVLLFSLLVPLFVGIWLDQKLHTSPLFVLLGAALGILAATVGVARMVLRTFAQASRPGPDQAPGADGEVAKHPDCEASRSRSIPTEGSGPKGADHRERTASPKTEESD
jgi:hypothetical protein